ncbi:hypothetical protein Trydic_g22370 [Trypoxylus dichotomus]
MRIILISVFLLNLANGAPVMNVVPVPVPVYPMGYPAFTLPYQQRPKIFWNGIGEWISGSDWFPIEVNVPDVISNVVSGVSGIIGNSVQRIPVINRITSPVQPRPLPYYMVLPMPADQIPYSVYP